MKRKSLFNILTFGCLALMQIACEDAKNDTIDNLAFINEATEAKSMDVTLKENDATNAAFVIRLAHAVDKDVKATIVLDETLLKEYNKKNETSYKMPDASAVSFSENVVIKAGSVSASPVNVTINKLIEKAQFALPFRIKQVEGGIDKTESSSSIIMVLMKPLKQATPNLNWHNGMEASWKEKIHLSNYTLEWWCRMSAFSKNNQAIFDSGDGDKSTELYIRFGDEIYAKGSKFLYNYLQVKTMGSQLDTGDPSQGKGLAANTWYHFALTYDAVSGTSKLYMNGVQIGTLSTTAGREMIFSHFKMISSGSQYFPDQCDLCQVRLWKVTRTANQIRQNMYAEVEYSHKDLVLYLPMNEGKGGKFNDVTGNGHDAEAGNMYPKDVQGKIVNWQESEFKKK